MIATNFTAVTLLLLVFNSISAGAVTIWPSAIWATIALASFLIWCKALLSCRPASFMLLTPLLFLRLTEFISGVAIESGAQIDELADVGYATGAFNRLFAINIFFFALTSEIIERRWPEIRDVMQRTAGEPEELLPGFRIFCAIACGTVIFLLGFGLMNGFPLLENIDKFRYRLDAQNQVFISAMNNRQLLVLVLAVYATQAKRSRLVICLITLIVLLSILYSEKFTSLAMILILASMPMALKRLALGEILPIRTVAVGVIGISILTLPVILYVYGATTDFDTALDRLLSRATSQGELWWVGDRDHWSLMNLQLSTLKVDVESWFNIAAQDPLSVGMQFGMYYVMSTYAPSEIAYAAMEYGTGYVFPLYCYLLMVSGVVGLAIIGVLCHWIYITAMLWIAKGMMTSSALLILVAAKIYIFAVPDGFTIGYLWSFFGLKTVGMLILGTILSANERKLRPAAIRIHDDIQRVARRPSSEY